MGILVWTAAVVLISAYLAAGQDLCSPASRSSNLDACLLAIRTGVMDVDKFWFGTKYPSICPAGPYGLGCFNAAYPRQDSIGSRIFPDGINVTQIEKFLTVSYTSEADIKQALTLKQMPMCPDDDNAGTERVGPIVHSNMGSYDACGHTFNMGAWQSDISPTSNTVMLPWNLRNMPQMSWTANPNEFYTIVFFDVGNSIIHAIYVNIPGNNVAAGEVKRRYNGPKVSYDRTNVYAFFLFKQSGRVTISQEWQSKINSFTMDTVFSVPEFAAANNMMGPVAVNWVVATGDEYAAQFMEDSRVLYTCPVLLSKKLDEKALLFLPSPSSLTVSVSVYFINRPITYTLCCTVTNIQSSEFLLDPYEDTLYNTAVVRSENSPSISFRKAGMYASSTVFTGDMYTLIVADPDVPPAFSSFGTQERPILHQMIVNIVNGDIRTGNVTVPYTGPSPPNNSPHYYFFLLYKQESMLNPTEMRTYAGEACERCQYNVNQLVQDKNLKLVGANWMTAINDDYVTFRRLDTSDPVAVANTCVGRQGYDDPCPDETSAGSAVFIPYYLLLLTTIVCSLRAVC